MLLITLIQREIQTFYVITVLNSFKVIAESFITCLHAFN